MTHQLSQWQADERVSIQLEMEIVQMLQENHGGWRPEMSRVLGRIGKIVTVGYHTVDVEYGPNEKWTLNPAILTRVLPFELGDRVRVLEDERRVKELQRDHGGWVDAMANTINQEGEVKRVFADGDLRVEVGGSSWTFNPHALIPLNARAESSRPHPPIRPEITPDLIFSAVEVGDLEQVKQIVSTNPQALTETSNGINPLHVACKAGTAEIVSYLLGQGMDPNQTDVQGKTPLMFCCEVLPNPLCARHLIQAGANPNNSGKLNNKYPLLLAVERGQNDLAAELLQSQKCHVHVKDNYSQDTAMHIAAQNSNLNAMMNLLDAGASPDMINGSGLSPLHVALLNNSRKVVIYLLERKPEIVNQKTQRGRFQGMTPLHLAILKDNTDCFSLLLDCQLLNREIPDDTLNLTPFLFAIYEKKFHMLDLLIQTGCDVYVQDTLGNNALHILFDVNCDDYDTSKLSGTATTLLKVFDLVEQQFGRHIRIAMCCFLIMNRIPYDKKNAAGLSPLTKLNPEVRKYCEDKAPPLLPDCALCHKLAEFQNCPCGHVTYCVVHAIPESRCFTCRVEISRYNPLTPSAEFRRRSLLGMSSLHIPPAPIPTPPPPPSMFSPPPDSGCTYSIPTTSESERTKAPPEPPKKPEEEGGALANTNECSICMETFKKVVRVAIDPCGHMCCDICAERLKECHICRGPILKILRLFY